MLHVVSNICYSISMTLKQVAIILAPPHMLCSYHALITYYTKLASMTLG